MKVYFASDIHLGSGDAPTARKVEKRFVAWLDRVSRDADAIVLDGDVFDFWFEYRRVVPQGFVRTLGKLAELTDKGLRIIYFTGNHDMWIYDYFQRECGLEVYTAPAVLKFGDQRIFVAHGDNMNIGGKHLLKFMNTVFRSGWLRWLFSWLVHPDWAVRFGLWWSGSSRKKHDRYEYRADITDPLINYARDYRTAHPEEHIDHFIFGHMHYARDTREGDFHVVNLGCWARKDMYAVLDGGDLKLMED